MIQDLRFALRQLLSARGFSLVTILTLALAIGSNTAIFSAIDAVLLHPLSYPEPDQLVMVRESLPRYSLHAWHRPLRTTRNFCAKSRPSATSQRLLAPLPP